MHDMAGGFTTPSRCLFLSEFTPGVSCRLGLMLSEPLDLFSYVSR